MRTTVTENADPIISKLSFPARDIRYLLERGYSKTSSIRFVGDYYRLEKNERNVLTRVIIPSKIAIARNKKRLNYKEVTGKKVLVDGYNVLIALESLIDGYVLWLCDDGFVRDTRGVFRSHNNTDITIEAVKQMCSMLSKSNVPFVKVLLDSQMSQSGELAAIIRQELALLSLQGEVSTSSHADFDLKNAGSEYVVATADGIIIDAVEKVIDLPASVLEQKGSRAEIMI
jgi:hypothetical protein